MLPGKHRIYHSVDLERFHPDGRSGKDRRNLAVGRLVRKKGLHILVEAWRAEAARSRFCPDRGRRQPGRGRLTALAAQQGLDSRCCSPGSDAGAVLPVCSAADILALPC